MNKKKVLSLDAKENILILLEIVKEQVNYQDKLICLNIAVDRLADELGDDVVDTIADLIIRDIREE